MVGMIIRLFAMNIHYKTHSFVLSSTFCALLGSAQAVTLNIQVEAPSNIGLAPALLSFHNGSVDFFDAGGTASAGLELLAEVGDTSLLQGSLSAGTDNITIANSGPFAPGSSNSATLTINDSNTLLTLAAMLLPSNDWFIGNDTALDISSLIGAANGSMLSFDFGTVYDAGTEAEDFAFSPGNPLIEVTTVGDAPGGTATADPISMVTGADPFGAFANIPQGFDTTEFDFNASDTPLGRITITVVPEPSSALLTALGLLAAATRRRR